MVTVTAKDCATVLLRHWIARFGVPQDVTTDQGTQFTSTLWAELMALLGIKALRTTSYHPQCNGMVERVHRVLKERLMARAARPSDWMATCPMFCWAFGRLLVMTLPSPRHIYSMELLCASRESFFPLGLVLALCPRQSLSASCKPLSARRLLFPLSLTGLRPLPFSQLFGPLLPSLCGLTRSSGL